MARHLGPAILVALTLLGRSVAEAQESRFHPDLLVSVGGIIAIQPGFLGYKTRTVAGGPITELDARLLWKVGSRVRLGLRAMLGLGAMKWSYVGGDGEFGWVPGEEDAADMSHPPTGGWKATFVVLLGPLIEIYLGRGVSLDFTLGPGSVIPAADLSPSWSSIGLAFGGGISASIARTPSMDLGLIARVDFASSFFHSIVIDILPQAGLRMKF